MDIFQRSKNNPILKPNPINDWESFKLYNPGAIFDGEKYHLFYRAMNRGENWKSSIGHAVSSDGEFFERLNNPALKPETEVEKRGLEDPRITKVGDKYFMAYAAYDGNDVRLCVSVSSDLMTWEKKGPAFDDFKILNYGGHRRGLENASVVDKDYKLIGKERSKSGAIFPKKIKNKYWMLFGEFCMWLASSEDGFNWKVVSTPFLLPSESKDSFDHLLVEMGPPPIMTEKGWLVLYHAVDRRNVYRLSFMILDKDDPAKILYKHNKSIFEPKEVYEMNGLVDVVPGGLAEIQKLNDVDLKKFLNKAIKDGVMPAVVFCCGAVAIGNTLRIYYGAGDSVICTALGKVSDILQLAN